MLYYVVVMLDFIDNSMNRMAYVGIAESTPKQPHDLANSTRWARDMLFKITFSRNENVLDLPISLIDFTVNSRPRETHI